jgi:hypothetical protein
MNSKSFPRIDRFAVINQPLSPVRRASSRNPKLWIAERFALGAPVVRLDRDEPELYSFC